MEIRPVHEEGDAIHMAFDSTDTFHVRYRQAVLDSHDDIIDIQPLTGRLLPAYISGGNYPFVHSAATYPEKQKRSHILWLLCGAGNYLRQGNKEIMPLPPHSSSISDYGYRMEHELHSLPPYIPRRLKTIRSPDLDLPDDEEMERPELDEPSNDQQVADRKEALQKRKNIWKGTIKDSFEASDFIETNGMAIPHSFSFRQYIAWRETGILPPCQSLYRGIVTNLTSLPATTAFRPPIRGDLHVDDARFKIRNSERALNHLNYTLTAPTNWPSVTDTNLVQLAKSLLMTKRATGKYTTPFRRRMQVVIILAIITGMLFLPYYLHRRAKAKKAVPNEENFLRPSTAKIQRTKMDSRI